MLLKVYSLEAEEVGEVNINEDIFGLSVRKDIIKSVVDWQLYNARSGTHKVKTVSEVSGTTRKPFKQKGTGRARQGSLRSVHMRGGGRIHGPLGWCGKIKLNKKVRRLGLMHALSDKAQGGSLIILRDLNYNEISASNVSKKFSKFSGENFLVVDSGPQLKFSLSVRNLYNIDYLPICGMNVKDILRHNTLCLSTAALDALNERLGYE